MKLEEKVQDYWAISSYWNGRVELAPDTEVPTVSKMIRVLQNHISCVGSCWRLGVAYTSLLREVISYGQKKHVQGEAPKNLVSLRPEKITTADDVFDRIVGGPYNEPIQAKQEG